MRDKQVPRVFVALDFRNSSEAVKLVNQLSPDQCGLKVGKELFTAAGPELIHKLVKLNFPVFLDLKFHDIPNTVAGAVTVAADLGVWMVNIHASGGRAMMESASNALEKFGSNRPLLTAVTVLTSLSESDLHYLGVTRSLPEQVANLAALAADCGVDGVVCSARETAMLRKQHGKDFVLVTPGIRPVELGKTSAADDQLRITTPVQAIKDGADYLVIGRPITQSTDPLRSLLTINEDISYIKH